MPSCAASSAPTPNGCNSLPEPDGRDAVLEHDAAPRLPALASPAAAIQNPARPPGASSSATSMSARSRSAPVFLSMRTRGAGAAASTPAPSQGSISAALRRPSSRRATTSAGRGRSSWRTGTEADFEAWRRSQAWTAWKYAMWDAGCRLPTQVACGRTRGFCGAEIDIASMSPHVNERHNLGQP
jgi:hypothetical protein